EWESEWGSLQEELSDDPTATLVSLDRLVAEMLDSRGYALRDEIASEGDDPEILAEFRAAHDVTLAVDSSADVDPGDVAMAVSAYRALYEHVINHRTAP
ncbi:MAG: hypothetical protein M3540_09900, partial [Actinomycetota bacterium]|nr:hypothetical protein [Actinomycetota bacterium]